MAKKTAGGYPGISYVPSLVLAIIPVTAWIMGIYTAIKQKSIIWLIIRLFLGFNIIWIVDLIDMIVNRKLTWLI